MLPHSYSEEICSLLPGSVRPGVSLILTIKQTESIQIVGKRWCLSRVRNSKQYSYDNIIHQGSHDSIPITFLAQVASELLGRSTYDSHEWIEGCMLEYNKETAKLIRKAGTGILRKHSMPDLQQLAKYTALGGKDLAVLANKSATYCAADDPEPLHYGLSSNVYCHCSSPIRRYADLFNQRILKQIICDQTVYHELANLSWLNQRQTDLKRFERDLFLLSKLTCNQTHQIQALILDLIPYECQGFPMKKIKLWIPSWKRTYTWKTSTEIPEAIGTGVEIRLSYFANPSVRFWKQKMVMRFDGIVGAAV
jgi:exoribonuclease R